MSKKYKYVHEKTGFETAGTYPEPAKVHPYALRYAEELYIGIDSTMQNVNIAIEYHPAAFAFIVTAEHGKGAASTMAMLAELEAGNTEYFQWLAKDLAACLAGVVFLKRS